MAETIERKHLEELVQAVTIYLKDLDQAMKEPSTSARGEKIAKLTNSLDIAKDRARYFGLNIDFRTGKPRKEK